MLEPSLEIMLVWTSHPICAYVQTDAVTDVRRVWLVRQCPSCNLPKAAAMMNELLVFNSEDTVDCVRTVVR